MVSYAGAFKHHKNHVSQSHSSTRVYVQKSLLLKSRITSFWRVCSKSRDVAPPKMQVHNFIYNSRLIIVSNLKFLALVISDFFVSSKKILNSKKKKKKTEINKQINK